MFHKCRKALTWYIHRLAPQALVDFFEMRRVLKSEPFLSAISHLIDRRRDAIDVGANIGLYTLFLKRTAKKIFAFEPLPALAAALRQRHGSSVQVFDSALAVCRT